MNLRQQTLPVESAEKTGGKTAWYLQTETPPTEIRTQAQPSPSSQALFDPMAAERILARAGALQEVHGQMLSRDQIEAIAAEIGIKSEFVRLAIEQESTSSLPETDPAQQHQVAVVATEKVTPLDRLYNAGASAGAIIAYGILTTLVLLMHHGPYPALSTCIWFLFLLPALMALALGNAARSRRWGAGYGAALGAAVVAAGVASFDPDLVQFQLSAWDVQAIAVMVGSGALLGTLGAQGRRVISRRAAKRRRERIPAAASGKSA